MTSTVFLGIDPSLRGTSIAETQSDGSITKIHRLRFPKLKRLELLDALDLSLNSLLKSFSGKNPFLSIEDLSLNSPFMVYEQYFLQGIFRLALKRTGYPFVIISPAKVKSFLGLGKRQDKESVRKAAENLYPNLNFVEHFKDDNDVDAFLLSRMAAISHAMLTGGKAPEMEWLNDRQIVLFHGEPTKHTKGRYKGTQIHKGIIQRPDYLMNWGGLPPFGWTPL